MELNWGENVRGPLQIKMEDRRQPFRFLGWRGLTGFFHAIILFFHPCYVLLVLALWNGPAFAQEYKVTVRQIGPNRPVSEALCLVSEAEAEAEACFMTAEIEPLSGENRTCGPLDVGMRFFTDRVNFNFMWNREYAFTQTYELREKGVDVPLDASGQGRKDARTCPC